MEATRALLTTPEACDYLRVSRSTLYDLHAKGELKKTKVAGRTRWRRHLLDRLIDRGTRDRK